MCDVCGDNGKPTETCKHCQKNTCCGKNNECIKCATRERIRKVRELTRAVRPE